LFQNAKYPNRIHIGLVEQRLDTDADCIQDYCKLTGHTDKSNSKCPHLAQIQVIFYSKQEARGPLHARSLASNLRGEEEFCLQIDSHMDFIQYWDDIILSEWASINNEYAVLSTVPPDISALEREREREREGGSKQVKSTEVPHLCSVMWSERGMIRNQVATSALSLSLPLLSPLWAAGMSFSKCHAEDKVPNDPNLPMIFDGEEFSKFARLWTRGYDVYSPSRIIIAHDYSSSLASKKHDTNPTEWTKNGMSADYRRQLFEESLKRLFILLGLPGGLHTTESVASLTKYGLGHKRTLDQLIEFTGIDLRTREIYENRCKDLLWVPFKYDTDPCSEEEDHWGNAPEREREREGNIPLLTGRKETVIKNQVKKEKEKDKNMDTSQKPTDLSLSLSSSTELWWPFQFIDSIIERAIYAVDKSSEREREREMKRKRRAGEREREKDERHDESYGLKTVEGILLISPLIFGLFLLALYTINGSSDGILPFDSTDSFVKKV